MIDVRGEAILTATARAVTHLVQEEVSSMRASRMAWVVLAFVATLALAVALTVGSAVASPRAAVDQSYTDPGGDAGIGTDIVGVTVKNDTAGTITIRIASANPVVANHAVAVFVDADRNQSTGDEGDEYWFFGGPLVGSAFFAWNGSTSVDTSPPSFYAGQAAANVSEFRINRADIGNVSGFNFVVVSISIDPPKINFWDAAPDRGYYSYDLVTATPAPAPTPTPTPTPKPAVVKPVFGKATITPAPVAGKRVVFTLAVKRSDTGKPLTTGRMICDPSVKGRVIRHAESFKRGTARLAFTIPKSAKGKPLRVKVTIKVGKQSATRIVTYRVK
jgi:hypothetical protein